MGFKISLYYFVLFLLIQIPLAATREEAIAHLFQLSHYGWKECSYSYTNEYDDFLYAHSHNLQEQFRLFEKRLNNLLLLKDSSLIVLDGTIEYLLPLLYLLRRKKEFQYYGIALGNLNKTNHGMSLFNELCDDGSFSTFQEIKETIVKQNDKGPLIIGLEREESLNNIYSEEQGITYEQTLTHEKEINNRLLMLIDIIKEYKPKNIAIVTRSLDQHDILCSNDDEKISKQCNSQTFQLIHGLMLGNGTDIHFFIANVRSLAKLYVYPFLQESEVKKSNQVIHHSLKKEECISNECSPASSPEDSLATYATVLNKPQIFPAKILKRN